MFRKYQRYKSGIQSSLLNGFIEGISRKTVVVIGYITGLVCSV